MNDAVTESAALTAVVCLIALVGWWLWDLCNAPIEDPKVSEWKKLQAEQERRRLMIASVPPPVAGPPDIVHSDPPLAPEGARPEPLIPLAPERR